MKLKKKLEAKHFPRWVKCRSWLQRSEIGEKQNGKEGVPAGNIGLNEANDD